MRTSHSAPWCAANRERPHPLSPFFGEQVSVAMIASPAAVGEELRILPA